MKFVKKNGNFLTTKNCNGIDMVVTACEFVTLQGIEKKTLVSNEGILVLNQTNENFLVDAGITDSEQLIGRTVSIKLDDYTYNGETGKTLAIAAVSDAPADNIPF